MARRGVLAVGVVVLLVGIGVVAYALFGTEDRPSTPPGELAAPATTTVATTTTTPLGHDLHDAACAATLSAETSAPVEHPLLVEVSGIAVSGTTVWVLNDSGDLPRIYGINPDGAVQVVDVVGAEAVDWEDLAVLRGPSPSEDVLWVGDIGGNIAPRDSVQLYRVPVPPAGAGQTTAERVDVTIADGHHDFESLMVEPDGSLLLASKAGGRSQLYRVQPPVGGGAVVATLLGSFTVGDGEVSELTSADLASDGSAVVLRTYGSVFTVPVRSGEGVMEALADDGRRCRGVPPGEIQGEAVGFLPDGSGYLSMGETVNPILTTVRLNR